MTDESSLLTPGQAADLKGVSRPTIYSAIAQGRLPHVRVLGRLALREADVLVWEPVRYAGRPGAPGRGGRPRGTPATEATRQRIAAKQRQRWAQRHGQTASPAAETYIPWRGFRNTESD